MATFHHVYLWFTIFVRAGGMLVFVPFFSGQNIPVQIRIAIGALLALAAGGAIHAGEQLPRDLVELVLVFSRELIIGLMMGAVARIIFFALEFAGQVMATEMGLMMSAQMDPISRNNSTPVGVCLFYFGILLFLLSDCHHLVIAAFIRSYDAAPIGLLGFTHFDPELFVSSTGKIFLLAIQMAAPLLAINFVVTFAFAILGKAAPSINVFTESFSVRILAGLVIFSVAIGLTAQLVLGWMRQMPHLMLRLVP